IRTGGDQLPAAGERVTPAYAPRLAKIQSPNRQPALATASAAHHWRIELLEFGPTKEGFGDIITLGNGGPAQSSREGVPHDLELDRVYVHGDPQVGQKRGIALNSAATVITNSYIADIKGKGQDTQAIAGWNGPGPYRIENNYLEGAGENFILGGSDPPIKGLIAEDVVFRRNHLAKPVAWRTEGWQVKNLFELKNARRVLVEDNLMEYAWREAQVGYAVLFTPRNQDGQAPWVTVQDVTFRRNVIRHAGGGMQIVGEDSNHPSGSTERVTISDNVFEDIDAKAWGGPGHFLLIGEGVSDITIERNRVDQSGNILMAYGGTDDKARVMRGFVFRDNIVRHNAYGVHGANRAPGKDTLSWYFPGAVFTGNTIEGGDASRYPAGNTFVKPAEFARLLSEGVRRAK
ncbi:MAG TPA: hypothetical protein VF147_03395, partial [Vicinamibacterales bacterium]